MVQSGEFRVQGLATLGLRRESVLFIGTQFSILYTSKVLRRLFSVPLTSRGLGIAQGCSKVVKTSRGLGIAHLASSLFLCRARKGAGTHSRASARDYAHIRDPEVPVRLVSD